MNKNPKLKGDLLLEFFTEEIPARMQTESEKQLKDLFKKSLDKRKINYGDFKSYSGPRHLSIKINELDLIQNNQILELRGPRLGSNKNAINGFLKSNKIKMSDLEIKDTKNGKFYFYSNEILGIKTSEALPEIVSEIMYGFVWSKSQRWGNSDLKWGRPLRNILLILNDKMVNGEVSIGKNEHLKFTNFTYGHRYNNEKIIVNKICNYEALLFKNKVILDRENRKNKIIQDINLLLKNKNFRLLQDKDLLEEVIGLVEFPNVLMGTISKQFMSLPKEVLSTAMKVHQKYFSLIDDNNKLVPKFIFVSNSIPSKKRDITITDGNQRVLKARLSDASFFWNSDASKTIEYWQEKLKDILFYDGLGSLHEKTIRMSKISKNFSTLFSIDKKVAEEAILLSKFDLASEIVSEFPTLQGIMGGYYSKLKNKPAVIYKAIFEHYKPRGMSDDLPKTKLGALLSIVDKIDTLTGFFVIEKQPSGSKDPFALRRAGFSIIRLLINFKLDVSINYISKESLQTYKKSSQSVRLRLNDFLIDKLKFVLKKQKLSLDVILSILKLEELSDLSVQIIIKRINCISKSKNTKSFNFFLQNFKRLNNILRTKTLTKEGKNKVNTKLFKKKEERLMYELMNDLSIKFEKLGRRSEAQRSLLKEVVNLGEPIKLFFDNVIVNEKDLNIRQNRLLLLTILYKLIVKFSHFDLIDD